MTGEEFKAIRYELDMTVTEFARALGYIGNDNSVSVTIRRYETRRTIPTRIAEKAAGLRADNRNPSLVDV